jgi:hypothetical protein
MFEPMKSADVPVFVAELDQRIKIANHLIEKIKRVRPLIPNPPSTQAVPTQAQSTPELRKRFTITQQNIQRGLSVLTLVLAVFAVVNGPIEVMVAAVLVGALSYWISERRNNRKKVYGGIGFSIPSWRDAVLFLIPLIPLLLSDLYAKPAAFGTPLDLFGALTWGFGSQSVVQTFFAVLERLPVGRFFAK